MFLVLLPSTEYFLPKPYVVVLVHHCAEQSIIFSLLLCGIRLSKYAMCIMKMASRPIYPLRFVLAVPNSLVCCIVSDDLTGCVCQAITHLCHRHQSSGCLLSIGRCDGMWSSGTIAFTCEMSSTTNICFLVLVPMLQYTISDPNHLLLCNINLHYLTFQLDVTTPTYAYFKLST